MLPANCVGGRFPCDFVMNERIKPRIPSTSLDESGCNFVGLPPFREGLLGASWSRREECFLFPSFLPFRCRSLCPSILADYDDLSGNEYVHGKWLICSS